MRKRTNQGLLFEAAGGTVFLDEITEMPQVLQAKLLRVIEEREVRPLGGTNPYPLDVRIISSSNRDMKEIIHHGRFREDLYYRLKVIDIELSPLRERREDIPLLVEHFIERFGREPGKRVSGVSKEALKALVSYAWPGNVRELENVIQRAITLCRHEVILPDDLPALILRAPKDDLLGRGIRENYSMDRLEKEYIRRVLVEVGGNKSRAAQKLGFDRKTLYRKLKDL